MFPHRKITEDDIANTQPKAKPYRLLVGSGLHVLVSPAGGKYWRMKYRMAGKQNTYSMGVFPKVSLKEAVRLRDEAKQLIRSGIDPNEVKRGAKKNKPKPEKFKSQFRMDINEDGVLTIETETSIIALAPDQARALKAFLATSLAKEAI
jgi:hypothetical protein